MSDSKDPNTYRTSVDEVIPKLIWVGNQAAAGDCNVIKAHKITMVVNCTSHLPYYHKKCGSPHCAKHPVKYLRIPVGDPGPPETPGWQGKREIDLMYKMMPHICKLVREELLGGGRVLIHCHAGAQRSAGLAAGYIMRYHCNPKWDRDRRYAESVRWLVAKRPAAFFGGTSVNFKEALVGRPLMIAK